MYWVGTKDSGIPLSLVGTIANRYSAVWSNSAVRFGRLVVYFQPSIFYLFGRPDSAVWARPVCISLVFFNGSFVPATVELSTNLTLKILHNISDIFHFRINYGFAQTTATFNGSSQIWAFIDGKTVGILAHSKSSPFHSLRIPERQTSS